MIMEEIDAAEASLRGYLAAQFDEILRAADFMKTLPGLIVYDDLHDQRVAAVMKKSPQLRRWQGSRS